jgi:stress response protein SCP2
MRTFTMGEKARIADLTAETALRVEVAGAATGTDIAAFCFAIDESGRIEGGRPPVSAARPASLASAVALVSGGAAEAAFDVDLDAVAPQIHRLLFVVASVGPEIALDAGSMVLTVDGAAIVAFIMDPGDMKGQRALILGEIYRRDGWRFGAVGQGYRDGLEQLVHDYGADPAALLAPPDADAPAAPPEPAEATDATGAAEAAEPAEPVAPETAAPDASAPDTSTPDAADVPPVVPAVRTYEGTGDRILRVEHPVPAGPFVAEITGTGTGNFAVWTLDSALEQDKLLVNEVGAYHGRVLVDERGTRTERLKIESDGAWTVVVQPPTAAPWLTGPVTGEGPEVLRWTGPRTVVAIAHSGASNFMVRAFAESPDAADPYLASLVNAIGRYEGESIVPAGPCLIEIEADGPWTVTPEGA